MIRPPAECAHRKKGTPRMSGPLPSTRNTAKAQVLFTRSILSQVLLKTVDQRRKLCLSRCSGCCE